MDQSHLEVTKTIGTNQKALFINLTQHDFTQEQIDEIESKGYEIVPMKDEHRLSIRNLIDFTYLPEQDELKTIARSIAYLVDTITDYKKNGALVTAMIGGAPFFQGVLERTLFQHGIRPCYAYSTRMSTEKVLEDGTVVKTSNFKHVGFVFPCLD